MYKRQALCKDKHFEDIDYMDDWPEDSQDEIFACYDLIYVMRFALLAAKAELSREPNKYQDGGKKA